MSRNELLKVGCGMNMNSDPCNTSRLKNPSRQEVCVAEGSQGNVLLHLNALYVITTGVGGGAGRLLLLRHKS